MGNCIRRETGYGFDEEEDKIKNLDDIKQRIVNQFRCLFLQSHIKNTWKQRLAEKDKTFKNVRATQNNIVKDIVESENDNIGDNDESSKFF